MKVAYFVNQYPKVSHSFIRREVQALERLGIQVERYALRTDDSELVDEKDQKELGKTHYILKESFFSIVISILLSIVFNPIRFFSAVFASLKIGVKSDRGIFRHAVYLAEACVLKRLLDKKPVEHIHAHFGTNSATVVMLCRLLGGPKYSFTVHGPEEFDKPQFISIAEKIKYADFVVAISSFGKSQLYRWIDYHLWEKVKVVHCGLEKEFYESSQSPGKQTRKFVCVGRLCEQKGQLLLVAAVSKLKQQGEEFQLVLAGDGPMRGEVEKLIKEHQLEDNVSITGWISSDQVRKELIDSTALVLPSFAEGLPVVIMESMALSRPVITTYIAGIPELVSNGKNGWLVPAGSLTELVEAMRDCLTADDEIIKTMGADARDQVIKRHDIDTEAEKLSGFFKQSQG